MKRSNFELWSVIFLKLLKFGPLVSKLLQTFCEKLQDPQILWAKVQKQKSYEGLNFDDYSDFLKLVNFGPHILMFLKSPREGLQATKILLA